MLEGREMMTKAKCNNAKVLNGSATCFQTWLAWHSKTNSELRISLVALA